VDWKEAGVLVGDYGWGNVAGSDPMNARMRRFEKECARVERAHFMEEQGRTTGATNSHSHTTVLAFLAGALRRFRDLIYRLYSR
jgi:hypothetical protein